MPGTNCLGSPFPQPISGCWGWDLVLRVKVAVSSTLTAEISVKYTYLSRKKSRKNQSFLILESSIGSLRNKLQTLTHLTQTIYFCHHHQHRQDLQITPHSDQFLLFTSSAQQFYPSMLDLRDLIIQRIDHSRNLEEKVKISNSQAGKEGSLDSEFQVNRGMLKLFSSVKKQEKERNRRQPDLLEEISELRFWQRQVLQNFYSLSLAMLTKYHSGFFSLLESGVPLVDKLQKLYTAFFSFEQAKRGREQFLQPIRGQLVESTPHVILSWLCQWSRLLLHSSLQLAMGNQFDRHEEQMRRINAIRSTAMTVRRQKLVSPLSISSHVHRASQSTPSLMVLTNKESVFGLCLDEMMQYYKWIPLELDTGFLKHIRKVHGRGKELEREQNLWKAAQILIQSKNKAIKEQIEQFRQAYSTRNLKQKPQLPTAISRSMSPSPRKKERRNAKPPAANDRLMERIKSQNNQEQYAERREAVDTNRKSLLLCPTTTKEISFDGSNLVLKKLQKERERKEFMLPELVQNKFVACHSESTVPRSKLMKVLGNGNRIQEDKSWKQMSPKHYEFKKPQSKDRRLRKDNNTTNEGHIEDVLKLDRRDGDELRRNRKLMLQLLREKNRNGLFQR